MDLAARYHAMPYLHEMGAALAAADLVISRAGASCLGEYPVVWSARHPGAIPACLALPESEMPIILTERGAAVILEDQRLE